MTSSPPGPCAGKEALPKILIAEKKNIESDSSKQTSPPADRTNNEQHSRAEQVLPPEPSTKMANINYLLFESAAGYAVFEVVNQADIVGLRNKEVQDSLKNLSTFTKYVKLINFTPYRCVLMETMGFLFEAQAISKR